jgi:hypothetical protein
MNEKENEAELLMAFIVYKNKKVRIRVERDA